MDIYEQYRNFIERNTQIVLSLMPDAVMREHFLSIHKLMSREEFIQRFWTTSTESQARIVQIIN